MDRDQTWELEGQTSINELLDEPVGVTGVADLCAAQAGGIPPAVLTSSISQIRTMAYAPLSANRIHGCLVHPWCRGVIQELPE
jgi:hypothetical protein